jgi:hypothetical protein
VADLTEDSDENGRDLTPPARPFGRPRDFRRDLSHKVRWLWFRPNGGVAKSERGSVGNDTTGRRDGSSRPGGYVGY